MLQHLLGNRLIEDGKVRSLTRRQPFTPQEDHWCSFLLEAEAESIPRANEGRAQPPTLILKIHFKILIPSKRESCLLPKSACNSHIS
jgi:hypothetical protein